MLSKVGKPLNDWAIGLVDDLISPGQVGLSAIGKIVFCDG